MKRTGLRTYQVKTADFPLNIVVQSKNLGKCDIVVSDVHVVRNGVLVGQTPVTVVNDHASLSKTYGIKKPSHKVGCDLVQAVNGWFGNRAPDNATYAIAVTSVLGDGFETVIGVPTIDPGIANLTFQYR